MFTFLFWFLFGINAYGLRIHFLPFKVIKLASLHISSFAIFNQNVMGLSDVREGERACNHRRRNGFPSIWNMDVRNIATNFLRCFHSFPLLEAHGELRPSNLNLSCQTDPRAVRWSTFNAGFESSWHQHSTCKGTFKTQTWIIIWKS